jgi:hypothetical protein
MTAMPRITIKARGRALREAKRRALEARYPALKKSPAPKPPPLVPAPANYWCKRMVLGRDSNNLVFSLDDNSRFLHTHIIGVPGSGKSNAITHGSRQDIQNGACVIKLDPHGNDPSSVHNKNVQWLDATGLANERIIHTVEPGSPYSCGFNPLFCPPGTDPTVIAGNMVEAVERGWGDQDSQERPTMRRGLRALFTALAELGLTLCEATYFLLPDDRFNARAWALQKLKDERARAYFERLDTLAGDPRMRQTFDVETIGVLNRIEEFTSSAAIRRVFGQREGIDLREVMDEGHVVLVNLAGGTQVYEKEGDLLGRLFLRAILYHAKRRTNNRPCFVWMDEGHRYVSGDIPVLFEEVRKHSVGIAIAHQDLSQLGEPGDRIRESILAVPQTRILFRLNSMAEATQLAPEVLNLNLETPVHLLVKPTVVGDQLVTLRNRATSASTGTTDTIGTGVTDSAAETDTVGENWATADTKGVTITEGRSVALGEAEMTGTTRSVTTTVGGAETNTDTASESRTSSRGGSHTDDRSCSDSDGESTSYTRPADPASMEWGDRTDSRDSSSGRGRASSDTTSWSKADTHGTGHSHASTSSWSRAEGVAHSESRTNSRTVTDSRSRADTTATTKTRGGSRSHATTKGRATTNNASHAISQGASQSGGWGEAYRAVYADLPTAVHSKENVVHMAAEVINNLPTGTAIVKALVGNRIESAVVRFPRIDDPSGTPQHQQQVRIELLAKSPFALPAAEATKIIEDRREWLKAQGAKLLAPPAEPKSYRQPLKAKSKRPPKRQLDGGVNGSEPKKGNDHD